LGGPEQTRSGAARDAASIKKLTAHALIGRSSAEQPSSRRRLTRRASLRCRSAAIEVGGNQILGTVLEHVICGGEDEAATAQIAFFGPRCVQAQELRLQVAGLCAGGGPDALHQGRLQPGRPHSQPGRTPRSGAFVVGRAQAGLGTQSATPGIVLSCSTALRKEASPSSTSRSI